MQNMRFYNVLEIPKQGADDGMYFVKTANAVIQYLVSNGNVYHLTDQDIFYGVERQRDLADPDFKMIGNSKLHETLPLHNLIRICKVDRDRHIVNYLNQTDIRLNDDGSESILDGSDGCDVMVHYPEIYAILDGGTDTEIWAIASVPFSYKGIDAMHIKSYVDSADYCTVDRTTNESRCVQSNDPNLAGSGSKETAGGVGYARTQTTRYNYELYAENKGEKWNNWLYLDYLVTQAFMYIEYRTRYLKRSDLFGTIGDGWSSANWSAYNSYYPVIQILEAHIGISDTQEVKEKGHLTGVYAKNFQFEVDDNPVEYDTTFGVYRGKILWGHLWKHISGVEVEIQSEEDGGKSNLYVQFDTSKIDNNRTNDSFDFINSYQNMGEVPRASGWAKQSVLKTGVPELTGGGASTFMTSYWWTSIPASGISRRCLLFGAILSSSSTGVGSAYSILAPSSSHANYGCGFRAEIE